MLADWTRPLAGQGSRAAPANKPIQLRRPHLPASRRTWRPDPQAAGVSHGGLHLYPRERRFCLPRLQPSAARRLLQPRWRATRPLDRQSNRTAQPQRAGHANRVRRRAARDRSQDGRAACVARRPRPRARSRLGHYLQRPKLVSVLWALSEAPERQMIAQAHRSAVMAASAQLEATAGWARRGRARATREPTAGLLMAQLDHRTNRESDPQLHTHAFVLNLAPRRDGRRDRQP